MIRTVVCQQEKCCGNRFYIKTSEGKLEAICKECGSKYELNNIECYDYIMISSCSKCNNDTFKLFRDVESNRIYAKCTECGSPPEVIFVDSDGVQVSYEGKLLQEVRELINQLDQRVHNLEVKIDTMEHGQEIIEQSLAYINKYIVQKG